MRGSYREESLTHRVTSGEPADETSACVGDGEECQDPGAIFKLTGFIMLTETRELGHTAVNTEAR